MPRRPPDGRQTFIKAGGAMTREAKKEIQRLFIQQAKAVVQKGVEVLGYENNPVFKVFRRDGDEGQLYRVVVYRAADCHMERPWLQSPAPRSLVDVGIMQTPFDLEIIDQRTGRSCQSIGNCSVVSLDLASVDFAYPDLFDKEKLEKIYDTLAAGFDVFHNLQENGSRKSPSPG